jgi:hypothetical protein
MSVEGKINTASDSDPLSNYIYIVALRVSNEVNPQPQTNPQPIFDVNPNGFVAGQPTHFIEFNSLNPGASFPYTLYAFRKTGNPSDPIDLAQFAPSVSNIINFTRPGSNGNTLEFEVFLPQLAESLDEANNFISMQVNFLTMNRKALSNAGGRVIDFLGDNRDITQLNSAIRVDLRTNDRRFNTGDFEPQGDTADPDLDVVDWEVQVIRS